LIAYLIAYAAALVVVSAAAARRLRGPDDFLMGGRGFGTAAGLGLLGGIFVAGTAVGVVGQGYSRGVAGAGLDVALGLGFAILLFTLLGRVRAAGHASVAALIEHSYGAAAGRLAAVLAGGCWLVVLAAFIAAAGRALSGLLAWSEPASIVVATAILLMYALPGGMRAVVVSNLGQLALLVVVLAWVAIASEGREPVAASQISSGIPWSYLAGITLLSTPTTVVAPDVLLGVASLRDDPTARRTVAFVAGLLAVGGLFLAYLGSRAASLVVVDEPESALPALIDLVLPEPAAGLGLVVLFGSSLAGAVSELMVCSYLLDEARRARAGSSGSLTVVRARLSVVALAGALMAIANPLVVDMVVFGFRVFVPAIVPQAVAALLGYRPAPAFVIASMVAGPATALGVGLIAPSTTLTATDPVLWGTIVSIALLLTGLHRAELGKARSIHETYE
jgi:Na+/proline symporter